MSRAEIAPSGHGHKLRADLPAGTTALPKQGLAPWMGHKPGTHPMLPRYPPNDKRAQRPAPEPVIIAKPERAELLVPLQMDLPRSEAPPSRALFWGASR